MDYENLYQDLCCKANAYAIKEHGEDIMIYPYGFAAIYFKRDGKVLSKNHPFVRWAVEQNIAKYDVFRKSYCIWVGHFNQSMLHKSAFANEFVRLLGENGITGATAWEKMD